MLDRLWNQTPTEAPRSSHMRSYAFHHLESQGISGSSDWARRMRRVEHFAFEANFNQERGYYTKLSNMPLDSPVKVLMVHDRFPTASNHATLLNVCVGKASLPTSSNHAHCMRICYCCREM